jgi:hypothetical protein
MKCTGLLVFSCVFTAKTYTSSKFHMHTKIHMYHIFYMKCTVFLLFFLCFHCRNMYTNIHLYHIFYIKCTVLLVFSCVFTVFSLQKHELLVNFTWIYQNTHVPYILHKMHRFASVLTVFSLQKHILLVHLTCIQKYTWTINSS